MPLLLDERAVASLLRMEDLIPLMRRTLAELSSGAALQPVRSTLPIERHGSTIFVMPGHLTESDALAIKVVSLSPRNAERGLPTHLATLLLLDPATGALLALMDARLITEMRTAAVSAAAADALARRDARTLALLGSGVQARSHLDALRRVRPIERVRVWSPDRGPLESFVRREADRHGLKVEAAADAESAVRGADLIATVTTSAEPVLRGAWLEPGSCVMAVGASRPDARELDGEAVRRARVFVDSRAAAALEAGDLLLAEREGAIDADHVRGEIGEVFGGRVEGRTSERDITLFKSLGQAVEDVAAARRVYDLARSAEIGIEIEV
jgi:ornithine cyclodeaminase/alanine dehydrogenase-like protein (mu-crystallin family)